MSSPTFRRWRVLARGLSERREQNAQRKLMQRALASMSSAISLIDVRLPTQPIVYVNAGFERLTGYTAAEAVGRPWTFLEGPETDPETATWLRDAVRHGHELRVAIRHHRRGGAAYWSETLLAPVFGEDGSVTHYMAVQKDVTESTEAAQRNAHLAYHDTLTDLPNRAQLKEHLAIAMARGKRSGTVAAVLFLDLDGFKDVNDSHGHHTGDQLLADIARRWRTMTREGDVLARHGGDEFVLLMADLSRDGAQDAAIAAAHRYIEALRLPFDLRTRPCITVQLGVSVGIALVSDDATAPGALVAAADEAMYVAKRGGGGRWSLAAPHGSAAGRG